jgi:hypothetical protein
VRARGFEFAIRRCLPSMSRSSVLSHAIVLELEKRWRSSSGDYSRRHTGVLNSTILASPCLRADDPASCLGRPGVCHQHRPCPPLRSHSPDRIRTSRSGCRRRQDAHSWARSTRSTRGEEAGSPRCAAPARRSGAASAGSTRQAVAGRER